MIEHQAIFRAGTQFLHPDVDGAEGLGLWHIDPVGANTAVWRVHTIKLFRGVLDDVPDFVRLNYHYLGFIDIGECNRFFVFISPGRPENEQKADQA
jgi:hypothetical protein